MTEFELIDLIVEELRAGAPAGAQMVLGPGDDASLVSAPAGECWVSSIDTLLPDVHFPADAPADLIGYRALAVSVSDLAAMGAAPSHVLISLSLPVARPDWVRLLARGMAAASAEMGIAVAGGNLARGPLNIAVSVHGHVPADVALRRDGARPGDTVFITGPLGGAALALRTDVLGQATGLDTLQPGTPAHAYFKPRPRLAAGRMLRGVATSAIDVSDGLLADAGHLASASGVHIRIDARAVPLAAGAELADALAGDDYELLFTARSDSRPAGIDAHAIGTVVTGSGTELTGVDAAALAGSGYRHFDDA